MWKQLELSGEPLIPQLADDFGEGPQQPANVLEFYERTIQLQKYRERYLAYWESTGNETESGT